MTTLREAAQAVLDRWDSPAWEWLKQGPTATLMSDLRAALAQEQAEPVAWYFEARHIDSAWAAAVTLKHPGPEGKYMRKVTPLYAARPIERAHGIV